MAKGATQITVKTNDGGHRATCAVTVYTIPVTSFTLDTNSLTLFAGATHTFTKNILPENASDKGVIWHCSNDYVASVSNEGVVTALGSGAAIITATTRDGGYRAACAITIYEALDFKPDVTLNREYMFLDLGQTEKLIATITRENAPDKTVTWSSSNPDIASVSSDGLVTAKTKGTVDITVKANSGGKMAVCSVGVAPPLDVPPVSGDVFVGGEIWLDGVAIATLWKNGEAQRLSSSNLMSANTSIFVSGVDVYAVYSQTHDDGERYATLWKNGVPVTLGNKDSECTSIFVSDGGFYVGGGEPVNRTFVATIWNNNGTQRFSDIGSFIRSVFVSGDDVYAVGNEDFATLWKNGARQRLSDEIAYPNSVFVSGGDVYCVGMKADVYGYGFPVMWKNGAELPLDANYTGMAYSCYVAGNDAYIAGYEEKEDGGPSATVWKNTEIYQRLIGDKYEYAEANHIFVSGDDIYVTGVEMPLPQNNLVSYPILWKNGAPQYISNNNKEGRATSVFVVK
jgi:hypothetical protein